MLFPLDIHKYTLLLINNQYQQDPRFSIVLLKPTLYILNFGLLYEILFLFLFFFMIQSKFLFNSRYYCLKQVGQINGPNSMGSRLNVYVCTFDYLSEKTNKLLHFIRKMNYSKPFLEIEKKYLQSTNYELFYMEKKSIEVIYLFNQYL